MTKRRLKPQFKTWTFKGFIILWIPWIVLLIYNAYILKSPEIREVLTFINLLQIGFAMGICLQAMDNYKQHKELMERMAKITVQILIKLDKMYKEKYDKLLKEVK